MGEQLQARLEAIARNVPTFAALTTVGGEVRASINPDVELCACSTTKVAAATAVMALVQDGVVDLDAAAERLDSRLSFAKPELGRLITLRMLLSHTSGLDDTQQIEADPLAALPALRHLAAPGRTFRYSNVAFMCGVMAAARAAGETYPSLIERRVFEPLGMTATRWSDRFGEASGHSAMATTARDLVALAAEQLGGGKVLGPEALGVMQRVHADSWAAGPSRYYGLGLGVQRWKGGEMLNHGGGLGRYGSAFAADRGAGAAFAAMFDDPHGYEADPATVLDLALGRTSEPLPAGALGVDWREYLGRYANGAELSEDDSRPLLHYGPLKARLDPVDERLLATAPLSLGGGQTRPVGVGLLPGEPVMVVVNTLPPIGARPGRRL